MRRSRALWIAICLGACALGFYLGRLTSPHPGSSGAARDGPLLCRVTKVTDGDTVRLLYRGNEERLRLLWIDTPERGEPGYHEAAAALKSLVGGRRVRVEFEVPGIAERDRFGRLLACLVVDGVNANLEMVRQGWSEFYADHGGGPMADEFREAETEARLTARGLWANEPR